MKKLKNYLSIATSIITTTSLNAGIVYNDIDPDLILDVNGENYKIDFDGDGKYEFKVLFDVLNLGGGGGGLNIRMPKIVPYYGNMIGGYTYQAWGGPINTVNLMYYYSDSQYIDSNVNFLSSEINFGYYFNGWGGPQSQGRWSNQIDKFVALKFSLNGNTHYGWARFDVTNNYSKVILKDYAYESSPNTPILTGVTYDMQKIAQNIIASDLSNFGNGLDLSFSFEKAVDEIGINEYRVFAVKAIDSSSFNVTKANASPYFISINPNGNNITSSFNELSRDVDGELIKNDIPYYLYVLSTPDLVNLFASNLSNPSNQITLSSTLYVENEKLNNIHISRGMVYFNNIVSELVVNILDLNGKILKSFIVKDNDVFNLNEINYKGVVFINIESSSNSYSYKLIL